MRFIEQPGNQQGAPPYYFQGVQVRSFPMPADMGALGDYCRRYLNLFAPECWFEPVVPLVYLAVNHYPHMESSEHGEPITASYMRQHEYGFMVPLIRWQRGPLGLHFPRLTWVFPFIGVDNATSAITGQEVLGFQKAVGKIDVKEDDARYRVKVAMPGFGTFGEQDKLQELLTLRATRALDLPAALLPTGQAAFLKKAGARGHHPLNLGLGGLGLGLDILEQLVEQWLELVAPGLLSVTNLKQFRDPAAPDEAAYSALVECHWYCRHFTDAALYEAPTVTIRDNFILAVAGTLGLKPKGHAMAELGKGLHYEVLPGFGFTADMEFGNPRNLLTA
jgi:hypothetical protein